MGSYNKLFVFSIVAAVTASTLVGCGRADVKSMRRITEKVKVDPNQVDFNNNKVYDDTDWNELITNSRTRSSNKIQSAEEVNVQAQLAQQIQHINFNNNANGVSLAIRLAKNPASLTSESSKISQKPTVTYEDIQLEEKDGLFVNSRHKLAVKVEDKNNGIFHLAIVKNGQSVIAAVNRKDLIIQEYNESKLTQDQTISNLFNSNTQITVEAIQIYNTTLDVALDSSANKIRFLGYAPDDNVQFSIHTFPSYDDEFKHYLVSARTSINPNSAIEELLRNFREEASGKIKVEAFKHKSGSTHVKIRDMKFEQAISFNALRLTLVYKDQKNNENTLVVKMIPRSNAVEARQMIQVEAQIMEETLKEENELRADTSQEQNSKEKETSSSTENSQNQETSNSDEDTSANKNGFVDLERSPLPTSANKIPEINNPVSSEIDGKIQNLVQSKTVGKAESSSVIPAVLVNIYNDISQKIDGIVNSAPKNNATEPEESEVLVALSDKETSQGIAQIEESKDIMEYQMHEDDLAKMSKAEQPSAMEKVLNKVIDSEVFKITTTWMTNTFLGSK